MLVDWAKVPEWLNYVTAESNDSVHNTRCYGWCSKPYLETTEVFRNGEPFTIKRWESFYCTEDDGLFCELPDYVAVSDAGDLKDFESTIRARPAGA